MENQMKHGRVHVAPHDAFSRAVKLVQADQSVSALEEALALLKRISQDAQDKKVHKLLAEIHYLLASEHKKHGDKEKMSDHAKASIAHYEKCNISSLDESTPILTSLLPDIMHEGVVRCRLLEQHQNDNS